MRLIPELLEKKICQAEEKVLWPNPSLGMSPSRVGHHPHLDFSFLWLLSLQVSEAHEDPMGGQELKRRPAPLPIPIP